MDDGDDNLQSPEPDTFSVSLQACSYHFSSAYRPPHFSLALPTFSSVQQQLQPNNINLPAALFLLPIFTLILALLFFDSSSPAVTLNFQK